MARTNYSFERRQRDLAKKKKAEEKLARKVAKSKERSGAASPAPSGEQTPPLPPEKEAQPPSKSTPGSP